MERRNTDGQGQARAGEGLIPKHGGYEHTKTWQLADLLYDVTVRFCDKFVDGRSRTHDQMVQAAFTERLYRVRSARRSGA